MKHFLLRMKHLLHTVFLLIYIFVEISVLMFFLFNA